MKKFNFKRLKLHKVNIDEMDDKFLLVNLYITQLLILVLAALLLLFQRPHLGNLFALEPGSQVLVWGFGFAVLVLGVDLLVSRWVPPEVTDDGGINELIFRNRPLWHIALLSFVVAFCEELLFRGAVQTWCGPYWTSIIFAAIHIRYLRHWLMTGLVFCISYGLGYLFIRTGTLWTPIAAHFMIDFAMGCILRYRRED